MEPLTPAIPSDPTVVGGEAGSIKPEPQGAVPELAQQEEHPQRSRGGSKTGVNSAAHNLTRPFFATEAKQLSPSLHQLQSEVQSFTASRYNPQGAQGSVVRG